LEKDISHLKEEYKKTKDKEYEKTKDKEYEKTKDKEYEKTKDKEYEKTKDKDMKILLDYFEVNEDKIIKYAQAKKNADAQAKKDADAQVKKDLQDFKEKFYKEKRDFRDAKLVTRSLPTNLRTKTQKNADGNSSLTNPRPNSRKVRSAPTKMMVQSPNIKFFIPAIGAFSRIKDEQLISSDGLPVLAEYKLGLGDKVDAYIRSKGKYYPGMIENINKNNDTYDIRYDDDKIEPRVEIKLIRRIFDSVPKGNSILEKGDKVEAYMKNKGKYYPGKIIRVRDDGTYDIKYDNGETEEHVEINLIRIVFEGTKNSPKSPNSPNSPDDSAYATSSVRKSPKSPKSPILRGESNFKEGDNVEVDFQGTGRYFPGKIIRDRNNGTYDIQYDDGDMEAQVNEKLIRHGSSNFKEGDRVEGNYKGKGKYYPGKISVVRDDGTYNIQYDDGETESRVKREFIHYGYYSNFKVGDKVEADYQGTGRYYPGNIIHDRNDGTYDIQYDDGDKDEKVNNKRIRHPLKHISKFIIGESIITKLLENGRDLPGTIEKVNGIIYSIKFFNGEVQDNVHEDLIKRNNDTRLTYKSNPFRKGLTQSPRVSKKRVPSKKIQPHSRILPKTSTRKFKHNNYVSEA
jgi:hypothetical protein